MTYQKILKDIHNKDIASLYLITGEENYFKDTIVKQLRASFFGDSQDNLNFFSFYAEDTTPQDILSQAGTYSFFSEKKLVVVNNVEKFSSASLNLFADYCKQPLKTTCLVFAGKKVDKRSVFFKAISSEGVIVEPKPLYVKEIKAWINEEIKTYGKQLDYQAGEELFNLVGESLENLKMEMEKLILFVGNKKRITKDDVVQIVTPQREYEHFDLTEAIVSKDKPKALFLLFSIIKEGKHYQEIIGLLRWQFLRIIQGKELFERNAAPEEMSKKLRMPPYFLDKFLKQIKKFSKAELADAFENMLQADLAMKNNIVPPNIVLERLIISLTR